MKGSLDRGPPLSLQVSGACAVTCRGKPSVLSRVKEFVCRLTVCMMLRLNAFDPRGGEEHGERYGGCRSSLAELRRLPLYKLTFKPDQSSLQAARALFV
jgi:hypothetical protein